MLRRSLLLAVLAFPGPAQPRAEPASPPTLVRLNLAATDAKGQPVSDLRETEVRVREDGRPQHIVFFRFAGSKRVLTVPGQGDYTNRPGPVPTIILLDRWNERMTTAAGAWIEVSQALRRLEAGDGIYIYLLTNKGDLLSVHPLPGTDADLRVAAQATAPRLAGLLDEAVKKFQGFRDVDEHDLSIRATRTFEALNALGAQMASIAGRKNLIWLTHGFPLGARLETGEWADLTAPVQGLSSLYARDQIAVYTVDESTAGGGAPLDLARDMLQMVSSLTGGRWYASNGAGRAIAGASADSRGIYTVAYDSNTPEGNSKYHKIRLDAARKGVRLQAKDGYFGVPEYPRADAVEAAAFRSSQHSPFDATEIGLRAEVSLTAKLARFRIHIDPADVSIQSHDPAYQGHLSLMLASYSQGFLKQASTPRRADFNFTAEQFEKAAKDGLKLSQDLVVDENIDKVRVMVFDRSLYGIGSLTIPIGVRR